MADFFGGILDNLRDTVKDANSFLGGHLGTDIATGAAYGGAPQNSVSKLHEAESLSSMNNVPTNRSYSPAANLNKSNEGKYANFDVIESQWLQRLRKFSQIDSELQAGKVNEGKPQ